MRHEVRHVEEHCEEVDEPGEEYVVHDLVAIPIQEKVCHNDDHLCAKQLPLLQVEIGQENDELTETKRLFAFRILEHPAYLQHLGVDESVLDLVAILCLDSLVQDEIRFLLRHDWVMFADYLKLFSFLPVDAVNFLSKSSLIEAILEEGKNGGGEWLEKLLKVV